MSEITTLAIDLPMALRLAGAPRHPQSHGGPGQQDGTATVGAARLRLSTISTHRSQHTTGVCSP